MTDQSLRRTDELLTELVEIVETARTLPMSSSCVLPRERILDLLDGLRETMPPEMDHARRTLAHRDDVLADAEAAATRNRDAADAYAQTTRDGADERAEATRHEAAEAAEQIVVEARAHAKEMLDAGRTEHARLVTATSIHQAARESAESLRAEATAFVTESRAQAEREAGETRAEAQRRAAEIRGAAEEYATRLTVDAEAYTDSTLAEMATTLARAVATAEQGRHALARRREQRAGATEPDQPAAAADAEPALAG
jgi:cell division septum initiation protein DivIVA